MCFKPMSIGQSPIFQTVEPVGFFHPSLREGGASSSKFSSSEPLALWGGHSWVKGVLTSGFGWCSVMSKCAIFVSRNDEQMSNKVGVLRTNRLWFLSRAFWRIHEMNRLDVDSDHEQLFFSGSHLSWKTNIIIQQTKHSKTPYQWMNLSYISSRCASVSATFLTSQLQFSTSFHSIPWSIWVTRDGTIPPSSHEFPSHHHPTPRTGDSPWQLASRWGRLKTMGLHPVGGRNPRSLPGLDMDENCGPLIRY